MDDYYEDIETPCPKCFAYETRIKDCDNCDEGYKDMHDIDPINHILEGEDLYKCDDCNGTGGHHWCPQCGWDFKDNHFLNGFLNSDLELEKYLDIKKWFTGGKAWRVFNTINQKWLNEKLQLVDYSESHIFNGNDYRRIFQMKSSNILILENS